MNSLKHAFPDEKTEGQVIVACETAGTNWKLSVSDNGVGRPAAKGSACARDWLVERHTPKHLYDEFRARAFEGFRKQLT